MKLSVCTGYLEARFGYERAFEMIKNAGFDALDYNIDDWWDGSDEKIKTLNCFGKSEDEIYEYYGKRYECAKSLGLEIGQTHSVFGPAAYLNRRDIFMDVTRKNILATSVLHSKYTVIHPIITPGRIADEGYDECHALNLEFFRSLIPDLAKHGVKIAIEPMWARDAERNIRACVCSRPEEILQFLDELGEEHFCACPDLGHIALTTADTGDTVGGALRKLGSATKIIHAHEITKNLDAHTKPYTYPKVMDWADIGAALREVGYGGTFNFEVGGIYYAPYTDSLMPEALRHLAEIGKSIVCVTSSKDDHASR